MADRKLLRLSATLLFIGLLVYFVVNFLHPHRENPNNDPAVFAEYANSAVWTAVHLGQFVGTAVMIAGLLVLFFALNVSQGTPRWLGFFGAIAAGVALALAGVVYAVDGVTLKQAVDAWVSAPAAEQAARFASAEAIRWLEWGTRSYYNFMFGLTLVLFATTIVWTARITRPIGYVMGLIGLAFIVQSWFDGIGGSWSVGMGAAFCPSIRLSAGSCQQDRYSSEEVFGGFGGVGGVLFGMATIRARVLPLIARHALWLSMLVWRHTDELV